MKKCFLFTAGSVYLVKPFTNGRQTFRWWRRGWNGGAEVTETTVKILLCCGFRRTDKAMGQVYQCWWRVCREINMFSSFEYHIFYVLCPFVIYLHTLPRAYLLKPLGGVRVFAAFKPFDVYSDTDRQGIYVALDLFSLVTWRNVTRSGEAKYSWGNKYIFPYTMQLAHRPVGWKGCERRNFMAIFNRRDEETLRILVYKVDKETVICRKIRIYTVAQNELYFLPVYGKTSL
jgi:hypothetical protein